MKYPYNIKIFFNFILIVFLYGCSIDCKTKVENDWKKENLNGKVKSIISFSYEDSGNNKIYESPAEAGDRIIQHRTYNFNSSGYLLEVKSFKKNGDLAQKASHTYDSNNNKIETVVTSSNGEMDYSEKFKYDKCSNQIEYVKFDNIGTISKQEYL